MLSTVKSEQRDFDSRLLTDVTTPKILASKGLKAKLELNIQHIPAHAIQNAHMQAVLVLYDEQDHVYTLL